MPKCRSDAEAPCALVLPPASQELRGELAGPLRPLHPHGEDEDARSDNHPDRHVEPLRHGEEAYAAPKCRSETLNCHSLEMAAHARSDGSHVGSSRSWGRGRPLPPGWRVRLTWMTTAVVLSVSAVACDPETFTLKGEVTEVSAGRVCMRAQHSDDGFEVRCGRTNTPASAARIRVGDCVRGTVVNFPEEDLPKGEVLWKGFRSEKGCRRP